MTFMKKSIKTKLTVTLIVVVVCLIGSILLFNSLFLEDLYTLRKENIIKKSYYTLENGIMEAYNEGYTLDDLFKRRTGQSGEVLESNLASFLRLLQETYGVFTVLMDSNNKTYSLYQNNARFDKRMKDYIYKDAANNEGLKIIEKNNLYTIAINENLAPSTRNNTSDSGPSEFYESPGPGQKNKVNAPKREEKSSRLNDHADLECFGFLSDNQTAFFLTIPLESIKEPIDLFNKVLIVVSLIALIIGSIVMYVLSNNFSKPILELSEIAKKMSHMEFEKKYNVTSTDEIGILGNAINEMSDKLERSIKELKNANARLKKDLEQKEQLDLMRQEFVANVSHELKTPISLIKGYAEGLESDGIADSKENRDYYVSVIKDESDKMANMVRQLLDLSSLERGMEELDIARINLKELVDGVLNNYEIKIKEKSIKIKVDIREDIYIWADGYKAEEVIRNYLSNAINYVDDNKIISLNTSIKNEDTIRFSIFNSGMQLSKDDLEKVWEKFYKVDKARTRSYGGTGLGLSIVKAIAKEHNTVCGCINTNYNNVDGIEFYFDFSMK